MCTYQYNRTSIAQLCLGYKHTTQLAKAQYSIFTDLRYTYTQVDQLTVYGAHTFTLVIIVNCILTVMMCDLGPVGCEASLNSV